MISNEDIMLDSLNEQLHYSELDAYMNIMSNVPIKLIESLSMKQYETMLDDLHKFEVNLSKIDNEINNRLEHEDFLKEIKSIHERVLSLLKKASSKEYRNAVRRENNLEPDMTSPDFEDNTKGADKDEL